MTPNTCACGSSSYSPVCPNCGGRMATNWWIVLDVGSVVGVVTEDPARAPENALGLKHVQGWRIDVPGRQFVRVVPA